MPPILKAVQYRNIDEARRALEQVAGGQVPDPFDDAGREPEGLLSVLPEDRLEEKLFYRLFEVGKGILVEVERIPYSGYGPPAEEADYMGFVSEAVAYVLKGRHLPIEIENCPRGARDIHHLEAMILDGEHPLDRQGLARQLGLSPWWDFEDLLDRIRHGEQTAEEIDRLIHRGIQ